jgi:hypothetical protein
MYTSWPGLITVSTLPGKVFVKAWFPTNVVVLLPGVTKVDARLASAALTIWKCVPPAV